tara:strand:+ start:166 stop:414 length:249 start_codon:yes stop_codon:yes gene_type:complete
MGIKMRFSYISARSAAGERFETFTAIEKLQRSNLNAEDVLLCVGTLEEHALAEKQLRYGMQRLQQACNVVEIFIEQNNWGQA